MKFAYQVLIHTPVWVFALLAFLVWQGIKAMRPRTVTIWRSLIVPAVFIVWGLSRVVSRQDYAGLLAAWLGAAALPLIVPAIAAGWMLAFTLSLDDVVIASFTTGPGSATLPIRIYSEVRLGVKPEINAICTMVIALIAVVIVIASLASKLSSSQGESAAPL